MISPFIPCKVWVEALIYNPPTCHIPAGALPTSNAAQSPSPGVRVPAAAGSYCGPAAKLMSPLSIPQTGAAATARVRPQGSHLVLPPGLLSDGAAVEDSWRRMSVDGRVAMVGDYLLTGDAGAGFVLSGLQVGGAGAGVVCGGLMVGGMEAGVICSSLLICDADACIVCSNLQMKGRFVGSLCSNLLAGSAAAGFALSHLQVVAFQWTVIIALGEDTFWFVCRVSHLDEEASACGVGVAHQCMMPQKLQLLQQAIECHKVWCVDTTLRLNGI